MPPVLRRFTDIRAAVGLILIAAVATLGGALVFEHGLELRPCKLCLIQRQPYYAAIPLALATLALAGRPPWGRMGLGLLAVLFLVSAGLGAYHAGVEWGFWLGPNDCGGAPAPAAGNVGDFLSQLSQTRVVSCTEAAWRFLGLSMAGWNALISLGLAGLALLALRAGWPASERITAYGSSSVSQ